MTDEEKNELSEELRLLKKYEALFYSLEKEVSELKSFLLVTSEEKEALEHENQQLRRNKWKEKSRKVIDDVESLAAQAPQHSQRSDQNQLITAFCMMMDKL